MSSGFDVNFLGEQVPLPRLGENLLEQAWDDGKVIDYEHFSLVMNRTTKTAFYTAHNIDRSTQKSLKRSRWKIDPRVDIRYQANHDVYRNNPWDRGHMVRRAAVCWGDLHEARQANRDSFYYTNANLQHENFNQDEWLMLEDWILNDAATGDQISVFTGPVNTPDDQPYRGTTIPAAFWKVIVFTERDDLKCLAFVMHQRELWDDKNGSDTLVLQNYQVSLSQISQMTDLYFKAELYDVNPMFFSANNFTLENDIPTPEMHEVNSPYDLIRERGAFTEIYQDLWDLDRNAFSVTRMKNGRWLDENADIKLREQGSAPNRHRDQAEFRLFADVNQEKLAGTSSYQHLKRLMDNYNIRKESREAYDEAERREIDQLLDTCFDDRREQPGTLQWAYDYITAPRKHGGLGFAPEKHQHMLFTSTTFGAGKCIDLTDLETFKNTLKVMWFGLYTNHYGGQETPHCSGFEHIFVGEFSEETIGGYHYWTKFYWDEGQEIFPHAQIDYYGAFYKNPQGKMNTDIATLAMRWQFNNHERFKEKGGFFVGLSPECMLALGTVAAFESFRNDTDPLDAFHDKNNRHAAINHWRYDLTIYRETLANGDRGYHIRSFFPKLKNRDNTGPLLPTHSGPQVDIRLQGEVEITAALPNPEGARDMNEWVLLRNTTPDHVALTGWQVQTDSGGSHIPDGKVLPPGKEFKLLVRADGGRAALSNKGSTIRLLNEREETISEVAYGKVSGRFEGEIVRFS